MLRVGRLASSNDPESYDGGSVSSWQGHPSQIGQRVGARLSVVHLSSRLGVGRGANKRFVTKPHIKRICEAEKVLQEL
jgi:hypothetical protein